jgi:hypothetical protein
VRDDLVDFLTWVRDHTDTFDPVVADGPPDDELIAMLADQYVAMVAAEVMAEAPAAAVAETDSDHEARMVAEGDAIAARWHDERE